MTSPATTDIRTYGGWRRRRGLGLLGLGTAGTFVALGVVAAVVLAVSIDARTVVFTGPPAALAGALVLVRVSGVPVAHFLVRRVRWSYGKARGHTRYRAGVVVAHPRAFQLPGVLATTRLLSAEDAFGRQYGIVWDRRAGLFTATLKVSAASTWLAERTDADTWVANWGAWLASLGHMPTIRWVTVTVDTAPEPGSALADHVERTLSANAPEPAVRLMRQLVGTAPRTAARVDAYVSVTFDPTRSPAGLDDMTTALDELGRTLDALASALGVCGVTVTGRASAAELAGIVRGAFDPAARADTTRVEDDPASDLTWADTGPVGAEEHHDHYRHDTGVSVSWAWHEAPRHLNQATLQAATPTQCPGLAAEISALDRRRDPSVLTALSDSPLIGGTVPPSRTTGTTGQPIAGPSPTNRSISRSFSGASQQSRKPTR